MYIMVFNTQYPDNVTPKASCLGCNENTFLIKALNDFKMASCGGRRDAYTVHGNDDEMKLI